MRLFDSHCHLDRDPFSQDIEACLSRAAHENVSHMTVIGLAKSGETMDTAWNLADGHPTIWSSIGCHPHDSGDWKDEDYIRLREVAIRPKNIAIGETGLDYFYKNAPKDAQHRRFSEHIDLAREFNQTLICHIRDAHDDAFELLKSKPLGPTIIHCFTGNWQEAKRYIDLGFFISFSGIVTFKGKRNESLREAARLTPNSHIIIETDSPFLAPVPHRGKPCEPAFLLQTATYLAQLRDTPLDEFADITFQNTLKVFQLDEKSFETNQVG